jgi:amino-acid N-acetyltransferase
VLRLLDAAGLPKDDLTEAHLEHFFAAGPPAAPVGLVGVEVCGAEALLRSLVVALECRNQGLGADLVAHAERHARELGVQRMFLLTTTAPVFFAGLGYSMVDRQSAPASIRATREFADICPASSSFMMKAL